MTHEIAVITLYHAQAFHSTTQFLNLLSMASKLTQNLTEATVLDSANDKVPIFSAASPSELRYMTPANLAPTISDASTTVKGKVELATDAETITGTDTVRAITPSNITAKIDTDGTLAGNLDTRIPSQKAVKTYVDTEIAANPSGDTAPPNLLKNGNFINNSTNGYGSTPDDWTSSNANPVQGGIPALTKQNLIDWTGVATGDIEGLWPLNETSGNALDLSDNAYNLTDTNTVTASSDGLMASARDFELGNSEYFTGTAANANLTGSQTFFAFIKAESLVGGVAIGNSSGTTYKFLQMVSDGTIQFRGDGLTTNTNVISDVIIQAGKWYFIVGVYDSANSLIKVWVNGIKKQVTASGSMSATNTTLNIGRTGGTVPNYFDGLIQNACVLSVALTDNQVKKLFAETLYKGQKIRRATTNAIQYQDLPMDVVERLKGKTVALRADMYQEVASTGQISLLITLADGTTSEAIISATDATTGSWLEKYATGTIGATAVGIRVQLKHSTSDGNTWFKKVSLYEGSTSLPYDHSKDDWSRFPRLLRMDIPAILDGYQFEENRWFATSNMVINATGGTAPTYTLYDSRRFMFSGKSGKARMICSNSSGGTAGAGAVDMYMGLPFVVSANIMLAATMNRGIIGNGHINESAGTIALVAASIRTNVLFVLMKTDFVNIQAQDQSSTTRDLSVSIDCEID